MKKLYYLAFALSLLSLATVTQAATFGTGDRYDLVANQTVNDDLYVVGGNATIDGTVNGDLLVAAGNVKINGTVKGALFVAGGQIDIPGKVDGTARVAGGNVTVNGVVGKDLLVSAGNVDISSRAKIAGQLLVGSGQVNIAGETGKVMGGVGNLTVQGTAKINGDLVYTSDKNALIDPAATISGKVEKHLVENKQAAANKISKAASGVGAFVGLIGTILIALLLNYLLPRQMASVVEVWGKKYFRSLLRGFVLLIVTPFAVIFLLVTVVGIPLAVILGLVYVLVLLLAKYVSVIVVGAWAHSYIRKDKAVVANWIAVVLGALIIFVLGYIPVLGGLGKALIFVATVGVMSDLVFAKFHKN